MNNSARKDEIAKLRQHICDDCVLTPTEESEIAGWNAAIDAVLKALTSYEEERTPSGEGWQQRAEKAEAEVEQANTKLKALVALADRLTTAIKGPHWEGWAQPEDVEKLKASPPAPSGWQQRIAAMEPWKDNQYGISVCIFCGRMSIQGHTHDCLWGIATKALDPQAAAKAGE